jgi:hypothetical protein
VKHFIYVFIILSLFTNNKSAFAYLIRDCGDYAIEGYLKTEIINGNETLLLISDQDTLSEVKFNLGKFNKKKQGYYIGCNVSLEVRLLKTCNYSCEGQLLKINRPLDPFEQPASLSYLHPLRKLSCKKVSPS